MVSPALVCYGNPAFLYTQSLVSTSCGRGQGHRPCLQKCPVWLVSLNLSCSAHMGYCWTVTRFRCPRPHAKADYRTFNSPDLPLDGCSEQAGCEQRSWKPCSESPQKAGVVEREAILNILWSCGLGRFCNLENIKDVPNL